MDAQPNQNAPQFPGNLAAIIECAATLLRARRQNREAALLAKGRVTLGAYEYDNWDGGMWTWPVRVLLQREEFAGLLAATELEIAQKNIEQAIAETVQRQFEPHFLGNVSRWCPVECVVEPLG